jgi:hypothetical protein
LHIPAHSSSPWGKVKVIFNTTNLILSFNYPVM